MQVRWSKGGEADVAVLDGVRITLRSTLASAPGSPLEGALTASEKAIKVKVARCRKQDGVFVIEGRLIDATRELLTEIQALAGAGAGGGGGSDQAG